MAPGFRSALFGGARQRCLALERRRCDRCLFWRGGGAGVSPSVEHNMKGVAEGVWGRVDRAVVLA